MTLEDIKNLEHIDIDETENFVYITPEDACYVKVEDKPEPEVFYNKFEMLKQEEYPEITVICPFDPSTGDSSIKD